MFFLIDCVQAAEKRRDPFINFLLNKSAKEVPAEVITVIVTVASLSRLLE